MDINDKGYFSFSQIKRFPLKATASAILTLHAETVMADSCPEHITGSALAGIVCEFDTNSSVTVENGGIVGGISMNNYSPPAPSQILIKAGARVDNTSTAISIIDSSLTNGFINNGTIVNSTGTSINIANSSLTNGLINNGTISSVGNGLQIANSSLTNGIINNGTINTNNLIGMIISSSTVSGGISNGGSITSNSSTGVQILNSSTINGNISNSGSIVSAGVNNVGVLIRNSNVINGSIINEGVIRTEGISNALHIQSGNAITGGIINNGTLSAGQSGLLLYNSTLGGSILNSGSIQTTNEHGINVTNVATVSGDITNSGTINAGNAGLAVHSQSVLEGGIVNQGTIKGSNTGVIVSTSALIRNGLSNSGTIQGGTHAIYVDGSSNLSQINILGQSARVIGAVEAIGSTFNITSNAIFTSEGDFNVNSFNIGSDAIFHMANSITAQDVVTNAGTLDVGTTTQVINSPTGYVQSMGGVFQTNLSSNTHYGQLVVDNTVDLSQSGIINVQINQSTTLHDGDILSNVISGSTLIAPTNGFSVSDNSFVWTFIPSLNNTSGLNLTASINSAAYNACLGSYCQGAGSVILQQVATGNALFNLYATLSSASAFQAAASQATPELTNENIQTIQLLTRATEDTVPMWSSLHGQSAGDAMIYPSGKVWLKPYTASMTQNERNTVDGFQANMRGIVIGRDLQLSEDWLFGGAFATGADNMRGKSVLNGQSINSTSYQGMLYGAKRFPNHVYFAGQGLTGYQNNNTARVIPLYASMAQGSYRSTFTNLRGELGWSMYSFHSNLILTPEIDASYLYITQGSYQEWGSPMDLKVDRNNNSAFILGAYCNGAYHLPLLNDKLDLTITGYGGIADNIYNSQPQVAATFIAGGPSFTTFGVNFNSLVFRSGAGLAISNLNSPLKITLNYDAQTGNNAYSAVGAATIKYRA